MKDLKDKLFKAAGRYSYITVTSDSSVCIEGCRQILECSDILIRVQTDRFLIEIWGADLKTTNFNSSTIEASGRISSVNIERRRKGGDS